MRTGYIKFALVISVGIILTACGLMRFEKREPWRSKAEAVCLKRKLVTISQDMKSAPAMNAGTCGMDYPFKIMAFANGSVRMKTQQTLACPIIPAIEAWIAEVVQPSADIYFGSKIVEMYTGSYSCRGRNNKRGAKLSEHSFGNAFDVLSFTLETGQVITVKKGWVGTETERSFLREIFVGSCNYFTTVLGPGSDAYHNDHFHLDLARHDSQWSRRYCRPVLKFAPQIPYRSKQNNTYSTLYSAEPSKISAPVPDPEGISPPETTQSQEDSSEATPQEYRENSDFQ